MKAFWSSFWPYRWLALAIAVFSLAAGVAVSLVTERVTKEEAPFLILAAIFAIVLGAALAYGEKTKTNDLQAPPVPLWVWLAAQAAEVTFAFAAGGLIFWATTVQFGLTVPSWTLTVLVWLAIKAYGTLSPYADLFYMGFRSTVNLVAELVIFGLVAVAVAGFLDRANFGLIADILCLGLAGIFFWKVDSVGNIEEDWPKMAVYLAVEGIGFVIALLVTGLVYTVIAAGFALPPFWATVVGGWLVLNGLIIYIEKATRFEAEELGDSYL